jgi:hypothetical protein
MLSHIESPPSHLQRPSHLILPYHVLGTFQTASDTIGGADIFSPLPGVVTVGTLYQQSLMRGTGERATVTQGKTNTGTYS